MQAQDIFHFWFDELTDKQHFVKDAAVRCELLAWRTTAGGAALFAARA